MSLGILFEDEDRRWEGRPGSCGPQAATWGVVVSVSLVILPEEGPFLVMQVGGVGSI